MVAVPNKVAIIGLGLIGGSMARALRAQGTSVLAYDSDPKALAAAKEQGCIDVALASPQLEPNAAGMIALCVPPGQVAGIIAMQRQAMAAGALLTDVCSSKQVLVDSAISLLPAELLPNLVPGHPLAGTERQGFGASTASLFQSCRVILTPLEQSSTEAVAAVKALWRACGASKVDCMSAARHDSMLATASHLPHMLAYSLMAYIAASEDVDGVMENSAGGLRDFTRIAESSPELWSDIALSNSRFIARDLAGCAAVMKALAAAVESGDKDSLLRLLRPARELRQALAGQQAGTDDDSN